MIKIRPALFFALFTLFAPLCLFAAESTKQDAPPSILIAGDTHAHKLAPHLANSFGVDAIIYLNNEKIAPGATPEKPSLDPVEALENIDGWLSERSYDAVYIFVGHENSEKGQKDMQRFLDQLPTVAKKLKGKVPVIIVSDFIDTLAKTEEEKERARKRGKSDGELRTIVKDNALVLQKISKGNRSNYRKIGHDGQYYKADAYISIATTLALPLIRSKLVEASRWKFDFTRGIGGDESDRVFYLGGAGKMTLDTIRHLSNGKILVGGGASDMKWLPQDVTPLQLKGPTPQSGETGMVPFILLFDAEMKKIEAAVTLPKDSATCINRIRDTGVPTEKTGALYIAGTRKGIKGDKKVNGGFFIARLNGNFVDTAPTEVEWVETISSSGREAWDVNSKGECVYVAGSPHGWNWYEVVALGSDGKRMVVENWQHHWYEDAEGKRHLWKGKASEVPGKIWYSAFVFKDAYSKDSTFRSWSKEDFLAKSSDGNGGEKMGKWPFDAMFPGYWDPATGEQVIVLEGVWDTKKQKTVPATKDKKGNLRTRKHGYYGYKMADLSCEINTINFDRRNDTLYLGGCNKSHMGQPDFEPWVIAFDPTGKLLWWQRLYAESKGISTPDQYVDNIVIDYNRPAGKGGLVVTARAHGNNVNNFYRPDELVHPESSKKGFQSKFTGTHGNMHYRWLGRLTLDGGEVVDCTFMAEYAEQPASKHGNGRFKNPLLTEWPDWNSGWPDLNTTGIGNNSVSVDQAGNIYLSGIGRRPITTNNAFMQMPSPVAAEGSIGYWSEFTRAYTPDFNTLLYSSILCGPWDWYTGHGRSENNLVDCLPTNDGIIVIGTSKVDKKTGEIKGNDMPTRNVPSWGASKRTGKMGVIGILHFKK